MTGGPASFVWGAATAAYQIEGAVRADGRGPSIWDTFSHTPGRVAGGDTGDVACDHYHRVDTDVALMSALGLGAYRFSIAWPRVQPTGRGPANQSGLDFYDGLVDALLAVGIEPVPTLYHWDLPQALEDAGGWPARDTAGRFADYAALAHDRLGDRVQRWATLNEPWVAAFLGYGVGVHAPGRADAGDALAAAHHLLLGHGLAAQALRADGANDVGIVLNLSPALAARETPTAHEVARRVDGIANRWFIEPVLRGRYPDEVRAELGSRYDLAALRDVDLATIADGIDWLGVNYYFPHIVDGDPHAPDPASTMFPGAGVVDSISPQGETTAMGWPVRPDVLGTLLRDLGREYPGVPLLITENGAAFDDEAPGVDGVVHDPARVAFLDAHVRAALDARADGVDLRGYFAWSLLDNFEWAEGYAKRFGLHYVDYDTLERFPKASAQWYARTIAAGTPVAP